MVNDSDCLWKMNLSIEIEYEKSWINFLQKTNCKQN